MRRTFLDQTPIRMGTPEEFVCVARTLKDASFDEETDKPFDAHVRFDSWMVPLLVRLDGKTSLAKIYEDASTEGSIPEEFKLENFAVLIARALEMGFVVLA